MSGQFDILPPAADAPEGDYHEHYRWALDQILTIINNQIAYLEAYRLTIDTAKIMQSRAEAGLRALVSMSPDAVLFRRYEAASERALNRTLQQIADLRQQSARQQADATQAHEAMAANGGRCPRWPSTKPHWVRFIRGRISNQVARSDQPDLFRSRPTGRPGGRKRVRSGGQRPTEPGD